ncbi:hypothetical protein HYH96_17410 [Clostridium botulinum]|uniref:Uncharacterized protein n=1 Tax=Clostridium botulinum TaxID=1491 RepID=A0A846J8B6_CLOBO|nr:hypothetical protein [Clostridium botulinum]ACA57380.1 hypothetical protein CLK_A0008 [Clostridium botulinum A3 str. Loch Maree]MBD5631142.1 hypothetical protein [Clostridium botulinum]MBD5645651.1 hypothetical protein [Clostridium botulinum]NFH65542.1 hypothetical protein [Clostridium botulinum]NFJ09400.1 hypothetical protein [Clostridium botulinum]
MPHYIIQNNNNEIIVQLINGKPCIYIFTDLLLALQFNSENTFIISSINIRELHSLLSFCNDKFIRYVNLDSKLLSITDFKNKMQKQSSLLKQQLNNYLRSDKEFNPYILIEILKLMDVHVLLNKDNTIALLNNSAFAFTSSDFTQNIVDTNKFYIKNIPFFELIDFCENNSEINNVIFNKDSKGYSFTLTSNFIKSNNN